MATWDESTPTYKHMERVSRALHGFVQEHGAPNTVSCGELSNHHLNLSAMLIGRVGKRYLTDMLALFPIRDDSDNELKIEYKNGTFHISKKPKSVKVRDWSTTFTRGSDDDPPETRGLSIAGLWPDGQRRISSAVVTKLGPRLLQTASGSIYELDGDPRPEYAEFCAKMGKPLNLEDPVKIIDSGGATLV